MGAPDLLANLAAIGVTVAAQGSNLIVQPWSRVPEDMRLALRAAKPELMAMLTPPPARPYRLTPAEMRVANADPWDDAACARFEARARHLVRLGYRDQDAEDLAERLHLRDVHADYRHLCPECRHYRPGWCGNREAAGLLTAEVGRGMATVFQHCSGFVPLEGTE